MNEFRRAVTIIESDDGGLKVVATMGESERKINPETVVKMMHQAIDLFASTQLVHSEGNAWPT